MSRQCKTLRLPLGALAGFLSPGGHAYTVSEGIPPDATVKSALVWLHSNELHLTIESAEFPAVPLGTKYPEVVPVVEEGV